MKHRYRLGGDRWLRHAERDSGLRPVEPGVRLADQGIRSLGGTQAAPRAYVSETETRRRGGKATEGVEWTYRVTSLEDPVLVVRRVGPGLARIEDFSGRRYGETMPVDEAISALLAISGP